MKYNFLEKYNKVRISKCVTYSYIIYHAYYSKHRNQPLTNSTTSKTSYMLDFNEVFWHADKHGKNAENAKNTQKTRKNSWKTRKISRKIADSENFFADALNCRWMPMQTRIIFPPLPPATADGSSIHSRGI